MSTNDPRVQSFIRTAMTTARGKGDACCGATCSAFRDLQAQRQIPGRSLDLDLAAAEHYMFARCMVCSGQISSAQMKLLTVAYDAKKLFDRARGDPNAEQVTSNPPSRPDFDVVKWGLKGCDEGKADHDRCNAGASPPAWAKLETVLGKGIGPY